MKIPVFNPQITAQDIFAVTRALSQGEISGNFGENLDSFETEFAKYCGVKHGVATTSGTTALHLAIASLELEPGSEVLISSSTNIATALAVVHNGLVPVPVDCEMETWNLDLDLLQSLLTSRTRAIIPVHLFGHPVYMPRLMKFAQLHSLHVVEDCAESHGATIDGTMTGSFGEMGCFSFYANKILTTGEGGMVITNNDELADKLRSFRNLGFREPRFVHEIAGFNFRMTGYQAALGLSQLTRIDEILANKIRVASLYNQHLSQISDITIPKQMSWAKHVYWMYGILISKNAKKSRDEVMSTLRSLGVETRTFFCPMDAQPVLTKKFKMTSCPNAFELWQNGLYLPSSPQLSEEEIVYVVEALAECIR